MKQVSTIGLDLSKHVFQVLGADNEGSRVFNRKLRRNEVLRFFGRLPPCLVGMEECGAAHYRGREIANASILNGNNQAYVSRNPALATPHQTCILKVLQKVSVSMSKASTSKAPSLATVTACFIFLSLLIGTVVVFNAVSDRMRDYQEASLRIAVETRSRGVQTAFAASLYREWANLESLSRPLTVGNPIEVQDDLSMLVGQGHIVSWAGYAENDGTVQVASNGLLVGANVGSRPWFQRGLQGNFAGDAHEAVLLAAKLPQTASGEPLRFLDLATPIPGVGGSTAGVLGVHLNLEWAKAQIRELANALEIDVFIVNPEGSTVISSVDGAFSNLDLASFRRAKSGATGVGLERWPDGKNYFAATLPEATYLNLPKFGWSIVARISAEAGREQAQSLSTGLLFNLATYGALSLLLSLLFIVAFIRPFHHLAINAKEIASGADVYPYESARTSELATIGFALATLQGKVIEPEADQSKPNL